MKRILLILVLAGIMAMSLQAGSVAAELEEITIGDITDESVTEKQMQKSIAKENAGLTLLINYTVTEHWLSVEQEK